MKLINKLFVSVLTICGAVVTNAQQSGIDSTGLPGDHFSLHGALEMFQKATSPENFEKLINEENNNVNNLDLNGDGEIDYVKVIDKMDKDVHILVLQVPVSETENQDIAVIEIEKTGAETAVLQIIGDDEIYGEEVIVEPDGGGQDGDAFNFYSGSKLAGPSATGGQQISGVIVNVWLWPSVRFIYAPAYRPWVSPWKWRYYPAWWKPWKPLAWHIWHPRLVVRHRSFVVVHTHRVVRAHAVYRPFRATSVTVRNRHAVSVNNYKVTRTKTTVTGPRGGVHTKTTTTVKKNGQVKGKKTIVSRRR